MTVTFAATFEFDTLPPLTTRGTVRASQMPTCFARAAKKAALAHPGQVWRSMVIVIERDMTASASAPVVEDAA